MKTITKEYERIVKDVITTYVANDGTEFRDETECKKYEESAEYVLAMKVKTAGLKKLSMNKIAVFDVLIDDGREEGEYFTINFKSESDINSFIQWIKVRYTESVRGSNSWWSARADENPFVLLNELKINTDYIIHLDEYDATIIELEKYTKIFNKIFTAALSAVEE